MKPASRAVPPSYHAPALEKGLDLLEALAFAPGPQSTADLARAVGRTPSEIFRMVGTLEKRAYIVRDESGCYRLSLKLYELSHLHSPYEELVRVSARHMRALSDRVGESCHLAVLDGNQLVIVAEQLSMQRVRLSVEIGSKVPALHTVSGRLLVAHLPAEERSTWLTDRPELAEELLEIQKRGYLIAPSAYRTGLDISVLVGNPQIGVAASLAVPCLGGGPNEGQERDVLIATLACAEQIEQDLNLGRRAKSKGNW